MRCDLGGWVVRRRRSSSKQWAQQLRVKNFQFAPLRLTFCVAAARRHPPSCPQALLRAFSLICPDQLNAFSAARYERGHHIAPHDDRAYTPVRLDTGGWVPGALPAPAVRLEAMLAVLLRPATAGLRGDAMVRAAAGQAARSVRACAPWCPSLPRMRGGDVQPRPDLRLNHAPARAARPHPSHLCRAPAGEVVTCSRDLTCVYYLTKDWTAAMGGALVDLEADEEGEEGGDADDGDAAAAAAAARGGAAAAGEGADAAGGGGGVQHPAQRCRGRLYVPQWNSAVFFRVRAVRGCGLWSADLALACGPRRRPAVQPCGCLPAAAEGGAAAIRTHQHAPTIPACPRCLDTTPSRRCTPTAPGAAGCGWSWAGL